MFPETADVQEDGEEEEQLTAFAEQIRKRQKELAGLTVAKRQLGSPDYNGSDIPELTTEQVDYIRLQQEKALNIVSDPENSHYEPDDEKRLTAARKLMREWEHEKKRK